jgi:hypothetical protein
MPAPNVDIVLVIDASQSMRPCFDQLRQHLGEVLKPMQGYISQVRFGLLAQSAKKLGDDGYIYPTWFVYGKDNFNKFYSLPQGDHDLQNNFFTDQPEKIRQVLEQVKPSGDEDMLLTLDMALDFPFGSLNNTKRVVALFSDERFEGGAYQSQRNKDIPKLIEKIQARHIQLFCAIPDSSAIQALSEVDRSEIELIEGGNGLTNVDFKNLMGQMGKSISGSMLQAIGRENYQRAIFGQDQWDISHEAGSDYDK